MAIPLVKVLLQSNENFSICSFSKFIKIEFKMTFQRFFASSTCKASTSYIFWPSKLLKWRESKLQHMYEFTQNDGILIFCETMK